MNFLDSKDRNNLSLALYSLENFGAEITKNGDKYIVTNNGIWGLYDSGGVMVLDADEIIELAEQYTEFIAD
jgi:hypothetical protein